MDLSIPAGPSSLPSKVTSKSTYRSAVTALYNVTARVGEDLRGAAEEDRIVFSPWHPVTTTDGPLAARAAEVLPIPGTTSLAHLHENLNAQSIVLSPQEMRAIDGITAPAGAGRVVTS